jgi:hypothetical protein
MKAPSLSDTIQVEKQAFEKSLWYALGGEKYANGQRTGLALDLDSKAHGDFVHALGEDDWDEILAMMARGTFKSSIGCGYVTWRVAKDRNFRAALVSSTFEVSQKNITIIEAMLESEYMEDHFGAFKNPRDWSTESLTVLGRTRMIIGEPTVSYKSRRSFRPGGHFDLFWPDDIEDQETTADEDQRAYTLEIMGYIYPMADEPGAKILTTGTYWHSADAYCKKEEALGLLTPSIGPDGRPKMKRVSGVRRNIEFEGSDGSKKTLRVRYFWKPAINADGSALFPDKLSLAELERRRTTSNMSASQFSAQYLLDPVGGVDAEFPPAFFEGIYQPDPVDAAGDPIPFAVFHGIDASIGRRRDGDYTAIVGVKVYADFRWHIFRATRIMCNGEELVRHVIDIGRKFPQGLIVLEEDNYVAGLRSTFRDRFLEANVHPRMEWPKAGSRENKKKRVRGYKGKFAERAITMSRGCEVLEDELLVFPDGDRVDTADALANVHEFATVLAVQQQIDTKDEIKHPRLRKFLDGPKRWRAGGGRSLSLIR